MAIWKKFAAILSLTFVFSSFAACGDSNSSGNGKNSEITSSQEDSSSESKEESTSSESSEPETEDIKQTYNVDATMKLAQTENGVDFQIAATIPNMETLIGTMQVEAYMVDGYGYTMEDGVWVQSSSQMSMEAIASAFEQILGQEMTSSTITLSYKNEVNWVLDYIGGLTKETTLLTAIDDVLKPMDTSVSDIKAYIIDNQVGSMTIGGIHTSVNEYLAANTEYADIDAVVDYILTMEGMDAIIAEMTGGEMTVEELVAMDIDEEIENYADVTINELITMLMASEEDTTDPELAAENNDSAEEEVEEITLENLVTQLEAYLQATTLGDLIADEQVWTTVAMCNVINVTKCDITLATEATFGELSSASFDFAFEAEVVADSEKMVIALNVSADVEIVETITAPDNAVCYCYECYNSSLEDTTVKARDNGYVLCDECLVSFDWECCEECWEKKEDCVYREDLGGNYCDDCAVSAGWEYCEHCWEKKEDSVYRVEVDGNWCDACYEELTASAE